jgi:hypothetical protein
MAGTDELPSVRRVGLNESDHDRAYRTHTGDILAFALAAIQTTLN